jgi:membrane protease YdiL (CAAX protease family)
MEPYTAGAEWATGILSFAGLLAPVVIALFFMLGQKDLRNDLLGRFFNFGSIRGQYILVAFFLMLISILAAQAVSLLFGYSPGQFQFRGDFTFKSAIFPVWFLLIAAPALEELAWHSYGTDSLRSRFNLFNASLLFAIFWGFWHFPLSFIKDYYHSNLVESGSIYSINFVVSLIPFVIIMNWLYYRTNRNIILPVIFHITAGFFNEIFATHPMSKVIQTGLLLIFSVYLVIKEKELFFRRI